MGSISPSFGSPYPWIKELGSEERGLYLIHLMLTCANHVAAKDLEKADIVFDQITQLASPCGDTMQRIAAYFTEALADRTLKALPGVHKALNSTRVSLVSDEILVRKLFFELFPFIKVALVLTNEAIVEAMRGEKMVHIIDLNAAEPAQWIALFQAMKMRSEGPPHTRITGIHQQKEVLDETARRLTEEAERLDIPFQFNSIVSKLESLEIENLHVKTGEALAICSVLQLHTLLASKEQPSIQNSPNGIQLQRVMQVNQGSFRELLEKDLVNGYSQSPDSSSSSPECSISSTKMDSFLNRLVGLSPKLVVVTEQDSNHNGSALMERLLEALYSYAALFDCLESTLPRTSMERLKVEKTMFGEEIKNIISCEGAERKERHEKLEKWCQRFNLAGFGPVPLSPKGLFEAMRMVQLYNCEGYRIKEENGCVLICWQEQPLFSVSAWNCNK